MVIDTHAHVMFAEFKDDIDEVIARAKNASVNKIINVGCDLKSCEQTLEMQSKYDCLYSTLGLHPYEANFATEEIMSKWEKLCNENKKIVAIGECGLDYFKGKISKDVQKNAFVLQIKLAIKVGLPLIIHNRDADNDTLEILDGLGDEGKNLKVVFHCYGSNLEFAHKLWQKKYLTSFTGIITYPSAKELRSVVENVPNNLFMVETDCPYLAPQSYRGSRNEPSYVVEVIREIARIKGVSYKEIEKLSTENALRFFERLG
ncbi:MAG: TatD family hydrolase [Candidatus Gracilibacteria bacterium]|jgi:TatD DNase family protein